MVLQPEQSRGVVVMINAGSQLELANANEVMSRIPLGVVNIAGGAQPPTGTSMTTFYAFFNAAAVIIIATQIVALVRLLLRPVDPAGARTRTTLRRAAPLSWELLGGLGLIWFATLAGMGWSGNFLAYPDLTLVIVIVGVLWLATGIVRVARLRGMARSQGEIERPVVRRESLPLPGPA
jgi:hypothetical protein